MIDERFLIHRLKATSLAGVTGGVALGGLVLYYFFTTGQFHFDLFGVILLMAATKLGALFYYRRTN